MQSGIIAIKHCLHVCNVNICRVTVVRLNEQRQIVYSKMSDKKIISLTKGEEVTLMELDGEFPIIISVNVLYTSPKCLDDEIEEATCTS